MAARPRDDEIDTAVLDAAGQLLRDQGYRAFSVEAISRSLGIAKTTIYARWPTRDALVAAVLATAMNQASRDERGRGRTALVVMVRNDLALARSAEGRALAQFMLAAQDPGGPDTGSVNADLAERRQRYETVIKEALAAAGRTAAQDEVDAAVDMLLGVIWGGAVLGWPVARQDVERIIDTVLHTFRTFTT